MAVGILQIPALHEPVYNKLWFVVSGSNSTQPNYKIIALVKDLGGNTIAKLKQPTDPTYTTKAAFDIHRVLESYVTHTIDIGADRITRATGNYTAYTVEFGEEYGATPAEYYYTTETATQIAVNIALSPREYLSFDATTYTEGNSTRKFLNRYKGTRKVFTTTKAFLYFMQEMNNATSKVTTVGVNSYNAAGALVASAEITQPYDGTSDDHTQLYFPAGPTNLNLIPALQLTSGTAGSVIPANTSYYDILLNFDTGSVYGEILRFEIIDNCSKYTNYPIYWLGQFGNVEVYNFNRRSDIVNNIERSNFKTALGGFLTSTTYGYGLGDRQETQYNTEVTQSVTVNTDNLSEAEMQLMQELAQSPQVWSYEDGALIPIIVTDTTFNYKKKANDKIFNFTMTFNYSSTLELQRY